MRVQTVASLALLILAACTPTLEAPDWAAQVREANEVLLNQGDLDRVPEFFVPGYLNHSAAGDNTGADLISNYVGGLRQAFPDLHVEIEILAEAGDRVTWVRTHRGTHQGEYMGVPGSGREIVWRAMVVSRYENGLIAEEWGISEFGRHLLTQ